ncbi:response regulator transcription factor [Vagococcus intermedius]|uniref:Response regulator transcription factor n=1 Tax=Vagococcus intermedius TaxID=2991418 RepID=A0AAF0CTK5_9ENTE|nr:response regulator transcription factor [Vagococcus intermedius]WEG72710.1 response regulator transcription factor [Vagococcus intermedius]WEG74795.1 response regulator transcription factor [Vagococcus intermedius]
MTTLYIAEDQEMLKTALVTILNLEDDFTVIGSSTNGKTALSDIRKLQPDVAILDIEMPKLTGLEVAAQLKEALPATKCVILTTFSLENYFQQAVTADVSAYLLKDSPSDFLIQTIRSVLNGATIYSPELVKNVLRAEKNPLSKRELEILAHIQHGLSTQEIAKTVFLSEGTVRNYISAILSKTGTRSRIEAINVATQHHWL